MEAGLIKNWNKDKGYGFVQMRDPTAPDAFLHFREIRNLSNDDIPVAGDLVLFDVAPPDEGRPSPKAVNALLIMQGDEP
jgi:cold shock CspA family protein